ncbi:MAG: class III poly(R)-hydroxyalkanoic acid synthase subunit PhaC [Deltaproteobacteria bacterium]|nr:class III poly(R)-hydroxyalkanoic acid synthase subunit PhaC [Deltaproteobacteria bacterium]
MSDNAKTAAPAGPSALFEDMQQRLRKGLKVLSQPLDTEVGATPKDLVFEDGKLKLFRYRPVAKNLISPPVVVTYALVNRYYMIDLQPDRSMVRELLARGVDIYVIDWGYPGRLDRFLTLEDYIDDRMNACIDAVRKRAGVDHVSLLGICQGGTFSLIYTSLYQEKVKNLVTMVTPLDFHTDTGLLNIWSGFLDVDKMVNVLGNIPGDFMNAGFLMLNPLQLVFEKYRSFSEHLDDAEFVSNFVRMERWIFDSPDQAGEAFRRFIKELYQENRLARGLFTLGGRKVDLKNITAPLLNVYGTADNLVPPACSVGIAAAVGSKDKETVDFPSGHIGVFVSGKSQKVLIPKIATWLEKHSAPDKGKRKAHAGKRG